MPYPLHDSSEIYAQCAIKFVHEHKNSRRKPPKRNGRKGQGMKIETPAGVFGPGASEFLVTPLLLCAPKPQRTTRSGRHYAEQFSPNKSPSEATATILIQVHFCYNYSLNFFNCTAVSCACGSCLFGQ